MSKQASVYFVSLGCPKNLVDSQVMLGMLDKGRYTMADDPENAEVIIVNTCSFIQDSKKESIDTLLEMADYKQTGKCKVLVAAGCLPQRYAKDLEKDLPEVDLLVGTGQYHRITEILEAKEAEEGQPISKTLPKTWVDQPAFIHQETDPRIHTGPTHTAFLKLSEGCNRRCAFCIIPKLRGNVRSRSIDSLVIEATEMAKRGVKELCLVAQDLTHYGMENRFKEKLELLLPELCKIDGIEWIRLHYVYPDDFSDELLDIIAREPKIVKYLDMPIQHTSDQVLERMNRRLRKEKLFSLVSRLRERIPGIAFRTSIIVGFPGETETQFEELKRDLVALNLDHVGIFGYSQEEGTAAVELDGQLPASLIRKRKTQLEKALKPLRLERHHQSLGKTVSVMIEGPHPESEQLITARLPSQAMEIDGQVLINDLGPGLRVGSQWIETLKRLKPGNMAKIEITEVTPTDLVGTLVEIQSGRAIG